jgi:hypothetical protein
MICLFSFEAKTASHLGLALFIGTLVAEGWHALQDDGLGLWRKSFADHLSPAGIERQVRQTVDLAAWVAEVRVVEYSLQIGQGLASRRKLSSADDGARSVRVATLH